jgi:hypothetical protein
LVQIDLRKVWTDEARDFTPWLAKDENLALLGEVIGMDLELEAQEKNVGPFRADILCKNRGETDDWVLIENQLEKTDHIHLGQLLTYGAGLEAVTIVWIAEHFMDEHRATLDWLNEITDERFNFFGLEIELWQIGESPFAPRFNIVSKPNDWSRTISDIVRRSDLTATKQLQLEYWTEFREFLHDRGSTLKPHKPLPQCWTNFALGRAHFGLSASVNSRDNRIGVGIGLSGPNAKLHFAILQQEKEVIESGIGEKLVWTNSKDNKTCGISLSKDVMDFTNQENWPDQYNWLQEKLESFYRTFSSIVKNLDVNDYVQNEQPEAFASNIN